MNTENMNKIAAVESKDFNFYYGAYHALEDINVEIAAKKITSLIGPSGCGKSTFLKSLNRINERTGNVTVKGKLNVYGENIYSKEVQLETLRKQVGMVFQRPNPLPISIRDNVLFGIRTHQDKKTLNQTMEDELVESSLKEVNLWNHVKDRLHVSALGLQLEMQQKLCIARLLPLKPKLILLDEPCSALDVKGTLAVEELMISLKSNYTIIIVTHSMGQAKRVSDECIFMYMGKIVESGDTKQMFTLPVLKQTQNYIEGRI
jgi:phosphate transport system ATP-binding protein